MPNFVARALFGILLLASFVPGASADQPEVGTVVGVAGQCFVDRGTQHFQFKLNSAVDVGDVIDVPADGKLKLRMNDGSILSIASGTKITVTTYNVDPQGKRQDVGLSLGEGLLRAVVAPVERPTTFEVKTATGTAAVRSTDWFIEVNTAGTGVAVLRGSVALKSAATGTEVLVPAGQSSSLATGKDPTPPEKMSVAAFDALIARVEIVVPRPRRPARSGGQYYPEPSYPDEGGPPAGYGEPRGGGGYTPAPSGYAPPPPTPQSPPPGEFGLQPGGFGPGGFGGRFDVGAPPSIGGGMRLSPGLNR